MKLPFWSIPIVIILVIVISVKASSLFAIPSLSIDVIEPDDALNIDSDTATFIVNGVNCVDTARTASLNIVSQKGVIRFVAYASHNRLEITYNPSLLTVSDIKGVIESPIYDRETGQFLFNQFTVLEINGESIKNIVTHQR